MIGKQMGDSAAAVGSLQVSVSFGRFENDSLSWDKWSSFSQNKYLEEVEKCATPGSVAEKKAYFEAHYRKIAARKAEILDQQEQLESSLLSPEKLATKDLSENTDSEIHSSLGQGAAEEVKEETNLLGELGSTNVEELLPVDAAVSIECASSLIERERELNYMPESPKVEEEEDKAVLVEEKTPPDGSEGITELPQNTDNESEETKKLEEENVKLNLQKSPKKATSENKDRNVAMVKKAPVSKVPKSPLMSTPRVLSSTKKGIDSSISMSKNSAVMSRPTLTPSIMSKSQSSAKKGTDSSISRSKNPSTGRNRKLAPTSLHMSLSLGPKNVDHQAPATATRKSLFMEQMGDKDIVKRAFKAFQNNSYQLKSSAEERDSVPKQMVRNKTELRASTSITTQKEKVGLHKTSGIDQRSAKAAPYSGLRSYEKSEKKINFFKKLNEKSNAKETESNQLRSRSKEEKEADIKKIRQSLNFKATPLPGFYGGKNLSKSLLDKERGNKGIHC